MSNFTRNGKYVVGGKSTLISDVKSYLHQNIPFFVQRWLPNGKIEGQEWVAYNPTRADQNLGSFKVNLKSGKWSDFATGHEGTDLVSLYAYINGISEQHDAAIEINTQHHIVVAEVIDLPNRNYTDLRSVFPVCKIDNKEYPWESLVVFTDRNGRPHQAEGRIKRSETEKEFRLFCFMNGKWHWGLKDSGPSVPYELPKVLSATTVIVAEGYKTMCAAQRLLSRTYPNAAFTYLLKGASGVAKSDISCLNDPEKELILCPDKDDSGRRYLNDIVKACPKAKEIYELECPLQTEEGDDLADVESKVANGQKFSFSLKLLQRWDTETKTQDLEPQTTNNEPTPTKNKKKAREQQPEINEDSLNAIKPMSWKELDAIEFAPDDWLIEGLIERGTVTLLYGPPKHGKSTFATHLAMSVADDHMTDFLGFKCRHDNVLYFAFDERDKDLQLRCRQLGVREPRVDFITKQTYLPEGLSVTHFWKNHFIRYLDHITKQKQYGLVIVDLFKNIRNEPTSNRNLYGQDYESVEQVKQWANKNNIAVLLIHHAKKGSKDIDVTEAASGTTGLTGGVESCLFLSSEAGNKDIKGLPRERLLHMAMRNAEGGTMRLKFVGRAFYEDIPKAEDPQNQLLKQLRQLSPQTKRVAEYLLNKPNERHSIKEIAEALGKNPESLRKSIARAIDNDPENTLFFVEKEGREHFFGVRQPTKSLPQEKEVERNVSDLSDLSDLSPTAENHLEIKSDIFSDISQTFPSQTTNQQEERAQAQTTDNHETADIQEMWLEYNHQPKLTPKGIVITRPCYKCDTFHPPTKPCSD